ncbi:unnamed protein product, partial [Prorocentrum cordatum]
MRGPSSELCHPPPIPGLKRALRRARSLRDREVPRVHHDGVDPAVDILNGVREGTCSDGSSSLEGIQQRFCAELVETAYPRGCHGFQNAFRLGFALAVPLVFNAVGLHFYRNLALITLVVSTLHLDTAVSMYGLFGIGCLDDMKAGGASATVTRLVCAVNEGIGDSSGFLARICILFLQLFITVPTRCTCSARQSYTFLDCEYLVPKLLDSAGCSGSRKRRTCSAWSSFAFLDFGYLILKLLVGWVFWVLEVHGMVFGLCFGHLLREATLLVFLDFGYLVLNLLGP